jgi:hypothetical protein
MVQQDENWRTQILLIGAVVGALVGVSAAYLYTQKAQDTYARPEFTAGDGMKLGLLLLGLLRSVAELGDGGSK